MSDEVKTERGVRKTRVGVVISISGEKSVIVRGERRMPHPVYSKTVRRFKKYHADDAAAICKIGDTVQICECRPISKTKRWRVVSKIAEGEGAK